MAYSNSPTTKDIRDRRNGKAKTNERTSAQVALHTFSLTEPKLPTDYSQGWFTKVRKMRKDPTISLIRDLIVGPIYISEWSIRHDKNAPEGARELVRESIFNLRGYLVETILQGWMDFGWQALEKVWTIQNGETRLDKVKPLLQDITDILVDVKTGEFLGIIQDVNINRPLEAVKIGDQVVWGSGMLKRKDVILSNINVEGTYWYGRPIMKSTELPYDGWNTVNDSADRYDRKIAGSHWVIHYPFGSTEIDGVVTDNYLIAKLILTNLESSGAIIIPRKIDETVEILNDGESPDAWKIELLSDQSSQQSNFVDRLKYYDSLKARALGLPERAVFEGQYGTKADSEVHSDLGIVVAEYRHQRLTEHVSDQLVDDILRYNYGPDAVGSVWLQAAPIADDLKIFLRQIFLTLMQHSPEVALKKINAEEIKEKLGLSSVEEEDESQFDFSALEEAREIKGQLNPMKGDNTKNPLKTLDPVDA